VENSQSFSQLSKQFIRALVKYLKSEARRVVTQLGKRAGLFASAIICTVLALIYLSIGIIQLLKCYLGPILPFFIITALLAVAGILLASYAFKKEAPSDEPQDRQTEKAD